ncbi:MAG: 3-isopropylmalate dehydratase small subunit [Hyphomicrobiaceae bacterium]
MSTSPENRRKPFTRVTAVAVPINQANVDTDQIIPARFLSLSRDRMVPHLFRDVRYNDNGTPKPEFVMNRPEYQGAGIIVAARNFACGSSREMAVTVIQDNGFSSVIAPTFGDIFFSNCFQNGVLPVMLPEPRVSELLRFLLELPGAEITVDLPSQTVKGPDGKVDTFEIDSFRKECLLKGVDEIAMTLGYEADIKAYEARTKANGLWA